MKQIFTIAMSAALLSGCGSQIKLAVDTEIAARAGQPVRFDAYTKEAPKSKYSWSFGDGSKAEGATLKHTYAKQGEYTAEIKVKGDGKRGKASIKVKVGPPSAMSVLPKETGLVVVLDDLKEARAAWDLLYKMPFLQELMSELEQESKSELGFFFLSESDWGTKGFDASLGGAFGVVSIEEQFVPLLVAGIKADGKATSWIKEQITKEGLTTKEEKLDGVTITHTYYNEQEVGALTTTASFLIYAPSIKSATDYHIKALKAAAGTAKSGSVAENEWLYHSGLSGGAAMYMKGGDFLLDLGRSLDKDQRELREIAASLRTSSKSFQSIAMSLRTKGSSFEADMAVWMTEEGKKNYEAVAPQVPLLSVSPALSSNALFYLSGRLDPVELAKQALAGIPASDRRELISAVGDVESMLGVDLVEGLGKPMGAANVMLLTLDGEGLGALLSGGTAMPAEFIWAYELEDTEVFQNSLDKVLQQASMFLAFAGLSLDTKQIGDASVYSINAGFVEGAIAVKPGVAILTVGPNAGTVEKALELISRGGTEDSSRLGEQKVVLQFGQLRQELTKAMNEMDTNGSSVNEINDVVEALKSFQRLIFTFYLSDDVIRSKAVLELTK